MQDRELLEAAAKVVGLDFNQQYFDADTGLIVWCAAEDKFESWDWNPLTDDGDALRLAVKIGRARTLLLTVSVGGADCEFQHPMTLAFEACDGGDINAATRRAIVRAAAAMGEKA